MNTVQLFFACDDAYVPFLSVALASIQKNRNKSRNYHIRILHTGLSAQNRQRLLEQFQAPGFVLEFPDISGHVRKFSQRLHTRDYYSRSTYYRLFIPELYPELSKALYLDGDLILCEDVARLYDVELGDDLVGAVPDGIVAGVDEFKLYVQNRLNLPDADHYFNAGVLLMNLDAMRQWGFTDRFMELLEKVTFQVGQDQDYLNVLCRDRVRYLGFEWNTMPTGISAGKPRLIHYNMDAKPWQRDDIRFASQFWDCAAHSGFLSEIRGIRRRYSPEQQERSAEQTRQLVGLGYRQAMNREENLHIHQTIYQVVNAQ